VGLNFEDFLQLGKTVLAESHYLEVWSDLRAINLGAEMIVATFGQDESVIMRIAADAKVYWEDHFSTIGTGGPIAEAFLVQSDYDDEMPLTECLARVIQAKIGSEKNAYVGPTTVLEILVLGEEGPLRYALTDEAFDKYDGQLRKQLETPPKVKFEGDLLDPIVDDDDKNPGSV
jgi:hypothetical protein